MTVNIDIDLNSRSAHVKLGALKAQIEDLEEKVDVDLNIKDSVSEKLKTLKSDIGDIDIDVNYRDLQKAASLKTMLQGDIDTKVNFDDDGDMAKFQDILDPPDNRNQNTGNIRKILRAVNEDSFERASDKFDNRVSVDDSKADGRKQRGVLARLGDDIQEAVRIPYIERENRTDFSNVDLNVPDFATVLNKDDHPSQYREGYGKRRFEIDDIFPDGWNEIPESIQQREIKRRFGKSDDSDDDDDGGLRDKFKVPPKINSREQAARDLDHDTVMDGIVKDRLKSGRTDGADFRPYLGNVSTVDRDDYTSSTKDDAMLGDIKNKLKKAIPRMSTFYNLAAALIPVLVVLATQALGVAAAMGAVAVAGISILGLGLVGHGDDMASSFKNAKEQISQLGERMFEVFQPTMQTFAPIQERFFDTLPEELNQVATAMQSLTVYSDTLFQALRGVSAWVANGFRGMARMEGMVSQLALRFGSLIGTNVNQFFSFLVEEAYSSQDMLISLGSTFKDLIVSIYGIFKAVLQVISVFQPLAAVLGWVETLLSNKLVVGLLTFVAVLGAAVYVTLTLSSVVATLGTIFAGGFTAVLVSVHGTMTMYIHQALATVMANHALAASIASVISVATLGVGAILGLGAAMSAVSGMNAVADVKHQMNGSGTQMPNGGRGGGGAGSGTTQNVVNEGDTYNMTVNGNMDNASEEGMRDLIGTEGTVTSKRSY